MLIHGSILLKSTLLLDIYSNLGEVITHADNAHTTLVIYDIQNSAQYACSGFNKYGEGDRLTSHITVIDPDSKYLCTTQNVIITGGYGIFKTARMKKG